MYMVQLAIVMSLAPKQMVHVSLKRKFIVLHTHLFVVFYCITALYIEPPCKGYLAIMDNITSTKVVCYSEVPLYTSKCYRHPFTPHFHPTLHDAMYFASLPTQHAIICIHAPYPFSRAIVQQSSPER